MLSGKCSAENAHSLFKALGIPGQPGLRHIKAMYKNKNCYIEYQEIEKDKPQVKEKKCQLIFKRLESTVNKKSYRKIKR